MSFTNHVADASGESFLPHVAQGKKPADGLLNRGQFLDRLGRELRRTKGCLADRFVVLCFDLDRFKVVTASLGRKVGDQLLDAIAAKLQSELSPRDALARIGGDEFAILIEEPCARGSAIEVAEQIQRDLINGFLIEGNTVYSTASFGIVRVAATYKAAEDVLRDAEIAMYRAKARGRARAEVFHPLMYVEAIDLFELETDLRRAVERGEFELFFQPIVTTATGEVRAFESLLRWRHPSRGLLSPPAFLDLLKETGLIVPVGQWVIREACEQAKKWQDIRGGPIAVTINLAPQQFTHAAMVNTVTQAVTATGVDPRSIVLEITEDALLDDIDAARVRLSPLRESGVRIMMDDFGTGYSSPNYLRKLPIDAIKIDASFVDRIERFAEDRMIIRAIVALAHALDLGVIAKAVERPEQLRELIVLECEEVQGLLVSRPVSAQDAEDLVRTGWAASLP